MNDKERPLLSLPQVELADPSSGIIFHELSTKEIHQLANEALSGDKPNVDPALLQLCVEANYLPFVLIKGDTLPGSRPNINTALILYQYFRENLNDPNNLYISFSLTEEQPTTEQISSLATGQFNNTVKAHHVSEYYQFFDAHELGDFDNPERENRLRLFQEDLRSEAIDLGYQLHVLVAPVGVPFSSIEIMDTIQWNSNATQQYIREYFLKKNPEYPYSLATPLDRFAADVFQASLASIALGVSLHLAESTEILPVLDQLIEETEALLQEKTAEATTSHWMIALTVIRSAASSV